MQSIMEMRDAWTIEDVRALDVEDWWRYQIVDGALIVSPSPGGSHALASAEVQAALWGAMPPGTIVVGPMDVTMGTSYLIPDLVVTQRETLRRVSVLQPSDAALVVEVVSPGSTTMDRIVKPAKYAAAGIAHFWRVETDPVSLTAYALPSGESVYTEVGTWTAGEVARFTEPFPMSIELDRLVA